MRLARSAASIQKKNEVKPRCETKFPSRKSQVIPPIQLESKEESNLERTKARRNPRTKHERGRRKDEKEERNRTRERMRGEEVK
jgi:hypothetical protein